MIGQSESELDQEQKLLTAVRELGALQREQLQAIHSLKGAREVVNQAGEQHRAAEYLVARSELTVSEKNLALIDASEFFKKLELVGIGITNALDRARRRLWSISSSEDGEILEAAQIYGRAVKAFHDHTPKHLEAIAVIKVAMKELEKAKAEHAVLLERQEAARQHLSDVHQEFRNISDKVYGHREIFDLEKTVVDLAHVLTGTDGMKIAYDCIDTKDLAISLTMK